MRKNYYLQNKPVVIPTMEGKLIEEHFGKSSTHHQHMSIAHMVAPPGWSEPAQKPDFDEWTLVSKGRKCVEIDGHTVIVEAGQSIMVRNMMQTGLRLYAFGDLCRKRCGALLHQAF